MLGPTISIAVIATFVFLTFAADEASGQSFVKNEVLLKVSGTNRAERITAVMRSLAASTENLGSTGWHRVVLNEGRSVENAIAELSKDPAVIAVQPNYYYRIQATPNDPLWGSTGLYGMTKISAPQAWDINTGTHDVVVANIDTGTRLPHEDLAANLWANPGEIAANGIDDDGNGFIDDANGWDFRFDDNDPTDQHGHGTHTAGTIGAAGNNLLGLTGVNWNVRLMTIKIYSASGTDTTSAMLVNAYNYVRLMKERGVNIRVTNNSYGGCQEACGYDQATKDAIDALGDAGILNVFAAGNNNRNTDSLPFYPGSYDSPSILNVANSNQTDTRAGTSNYGVTTVDIAAPGTGILSTTFATNSSYGTMSGTSMASPHAAGAAALLAAQHPQLSPASLKATLMNTVDPLAAWTTLVKTGGRLNVFNALQNPTVCSFTPTVSEINAPTKGGTFEIAVNTAANCDYSVARGANWVAIEGPSVRSGASTVVIRVRVNNTIERETVLNIGGNPVTVRQNRGQNF
jgi:subtilisin family serine protease